VDSTSPLNSSFAKTSAEVSPTSETLSLPPKNSSNNEVIKLSPRVRDTHSDHVAIPAIPLKEIGPFLERPLVVDDVSLANAPLLIGTYENRVLLSSDDIAYVSKLPKNKGVQWQIYRPGKFFRDSDTDELLGVEVSYLGDAVVEAFGEPSTLRITRATNEISKGDRFAQTTTGFASNFIPHAPEKKIVSKVISIYGGVSQAGQNSIVTLNKGQRDGLESGHVLAFYQKGEELKGGYVFNRENVQLPDVRYGLVFVFRVFEKVSYGLVLETNLPVQLQDTARTP
jgi:hypothetical protein